MGCVNLAAEHLSNNVFLLRRQFASVCVWVHGCVCVCVCVFIISGNDLTRTPGVEAVCGFIPL